MRPGNVLRVRERYEIEQPVWGLGHRPKKVNRHECDQHAIRDGGEPRHKTDKDDGDRHEHPDGWELHSADEQERSHITGDIVGGDAVAEYPS